MSEGAGYTQDATPRLRGQDLHAWLIAALARPAPDFFGEMTEATPLADGGLCLDSLALVDLIAEIETTLAVLVHEHEVSPECFGTIGRLVRFLETRTRAR